MTTDSAASTRWSKLVMSVIVPVVVAILVVVFTPVGTRLQSWLFPSSSTVHGSVKLNGQPVDRANVTLDGKKQVTTNAGGSFVLGKIREGDHTLTITVLGAQTHESPFVVKRNDEEIDVGVIELIPSLRIAGEGTSRWQPPLDSEPTFTIDLTVTLWLEGDDEVLSRVETVTYAMPSRLQPHPVAVSSLANRFCYQLNRSLELGFGESVGGLTVVTVTFDDGQTLTLTVPTEEKLPPGQKPPDCG